MQTGGGTSGSGGGLFSWLGNLFGGSQWSKAASGQIVGLFNEGGYTGPGGVYEPRGVVHAGEVVWSQKDVARAGGVSVVEAMRLGRRGYSAGGVVAGTPLYSNVSAANSNTSGSSSITVNNYSNAQVESEETTDERGNRHVSFTIADQVGTALAKPGGGARRHLQQTYGLKPKGIRR